MTDFSLQQAAALAKSYLYAFPKVVSGLQCPPHIKFIADKIQSRINIVGDKFQLLMITIPPRHGKSELISKHFVPWYIGNNPDKHIILASHTSDLAEKCSDYAKDLFEKWGPILWDVYPSPTLFNRTNWFTNKGGGVLAVGLRGGIIGHGADVFVIDDYCKDDEQAEQKAARDKIWEKWKIIVGTRLHPGCLVIILATRWHEDDLMGRLLNQAKKEKEDFPFEYEYIKLPAIAEENDLLRRKIGDALWKKRYNEKLLASVRRIVGSYWWDTCYQCKPSKRGGTLFKEEYFRYYARDPRTYDILCYKKDVNEPIVIHKNELIIATIVDPSLGKKKNDDPMCLQTWGYCRRHKIWVLLDRLNKRIEHTKAHSIILNFAFKSNAKKIYIENEKQGKILVQQSAGDDTIGGIRIPFAEMPTHSQDKWTRAVPMATYYENERVFHPKDVLWLNEYESNLKDFPKGDYDEDTDCTAYAANLEMKMSISDALYQKI
jgi:predicted phage terminase large subunit-like protein